MSEEKLDIAVLKTQYKNMSEDLTEIKADVKTLLNERHEGLGKKSVWAIIYGAVGAVIVAIIGSLK